MASKLSPFVYWGQNKSDIFLKIDLKEITEFKFNLDEDHLEVIANGLGVRGQNNYFLDIQFYLPVDEEQSKHRILDRCVEFQVKKVGAGESWPRLTYEAKKPAWLKIDFDHFHFDDSDEELDEDGMDQREAEDEMLKRIEQELDIAESSALKDMKSFYLVVYNMFALVGYGYCFIALLYHFQITGPASYSKAYDNVGPQLIVCQMVVVLEIFHSLAGFSKTNVSMAFCQIVGRNFILFAVIASEARVSKHPAVWWLFAVWSLSELLRYPYYICQLLNIKASIITWLRYSAWIILYPAGFTLEGFILLLSIPFFEETGKWSLYLPNSLNFSFHFPWFVWGYLCTFLLFCYKLFNGMYQQRKSKLGINTRHGTKKRN